MEIDRVIAFLQDENTVVDGHGRRFVQFPWALTGEDFLEFAVQDLDAPEENPRNLINALSNAKRALHCQVDSILYVLGFHACPSVIPRAFPGRLDIIKKLGVVSPRVLTKINRARNTMEHEYSRPQAEEVSDFVDIIGLFIAATSSLAHAPPDLCDFSNVDHIDDQSYPSAEVMLDAENGRLTIRYWNPKEEGKREMEEGELTCESPVYFDVIKAIVAGIRYT